MQVESFTVPSQPGLDTVEVFITIYNQSEERTEARVTVACFGSAWTRYFASMGGDWRKFLCGVSADYLSGALACGARIAAAIIDHLRAERAKASQAGETSASSGAERTL
jgi:hypothetical protein